MTSARADVLHLAGEIGPRGTGTPAEAAAADYVVGRLTGLGLIPEKHTFRTVTSQNVFPIATSLLALLSTLVYPWGGPALHALAFLLAAASAGSLWQTIRNAWSPIQPLLPRVGSQNVEVCLKPRAPAARQAVLLAHLDTNRCRLVWQSQTVRHLEPMTWLTLSIPALTALLYALGTFLGNQFWWWLSLPLAAYQLGTILTLLRDDRTPYSPGAHDNAASVAVSLQVAARLAERKLERTEVWFVFDGAEETDHAGVLDLLRRRGRELSQAAFFGLEGLGSGELVYLTRQGLCAPYRPDPQLLALAERTSALHPELDFRPAEMLAEDDVRTLRGRGYPAIGIAGRDPLTGILPRWHRPDDTPDSVSPTTMERAADILVALLEELDR